MVPLDFAASWTRGFKGWQSSLSPWGGSACAAAPVPGLWEGGTAAGSGNACSSAGLGQTAAIWTCTPLSWRGQLPDCTRSITTDRWQLGICNPTCLEGAPGAVGASFMLCILRKAGVF